MLISIVVPCYNEERRLVPTLREITAFCDRQTWDFEVLVVDDGSRDRTGEFARVFAFRRPEVRLLRMEKNRGKGAAVKAGMLEAKGAIRGFVDAGCATPFAELRRMLPALLDDCDVAIGSRRKPSDEVRVQARLLRRIMDACLHGVMRPMVGLRDRDGQPLRDALCGFKWFTSRAAKALFGQATVSGFAFDVEILSLAGRLGFSVAEIPVNWRDPGGSRVKGTVDSLRTLVQAAAVALSHRRTAAPQALL